MSIGLLMFSLLITPQLLFAQDQCWQREVDPYSGKLYSAESWNETLQLWDQQQPPQASLWSLFWAHQTYQKELAAAQTLNNDKRKHCFIGCRIAQETSIEVSIYVGWLKESEDLQDCDKETFFEPLDYQSTVDGALVAESSSDSRKCMDYCSTYKAPKVRLQLE